MNFGQSSRLAIIFRGGRFEGFLEGFETHIEGILFTRVGDLYGVPQAHVAGDPISDVPPKVGICLFGGFRGTGVALWPPEGRQLTESF